MPLVSVSFKGMWDRCLQSWGARCRDARQNKAPLDHWRPLLHIRPPTSVLFVVALLVMPALVGCEKSPRSADPPAAGVEPTSSGPQENQSESPTAPQLDADPVGSPAAPLCVQACVDARRTEAMAAEAIELQCEESCAGCVDECVQRNIARAVAPEVIDADCDRECAGPDEATQP